MPRVISFIVLLGIVLLLGAVFFQVMAQFIVPLFLASVLLVVFQPLHALILYRLPRYPRLAALATTVLILLAVLLPLTWLGWNAYRELHALYYSSQRPNANVDEQVEEAPPQPVAKVQQKPAFDDWLHTVAFNLRNRFVKLTTIPINDETVENLVQSFPRLVGGWVITGVQSAIGVLVGLAIMLIALYYFLADGPGMLRTLMYLSPLDEQYEQELLERFGDVSRAVVVATLLTAIVQGILAGIGYFVVLPATAPIFLLTALTMVASLVPFVGAAAVWICVCGWVYLYGEHVVDGQLTQGRPLAAILLAVYCTVVVSGIDNVLKPLILHGQSKLHPLLALLSILGGVQVLGPVGILVGPMLVSFLQALLHMLRKELDVFGAQVAGEAKQLAALVETAATPAQEKSNEQSPHLPQAAESPTLNATPSAKNAAARRAKRKRNR